METHHTAANTCRILCVRSKIAHPERAKGGLSRLQFLLRLRRCYWLGGRRFASCRLLLERLGGGEWYLVSSTALGRELSLGDDGTGGLVLFGVPPHSSTRSTRSGLSCSVVEGLALPLAGRPLEPGLSVSCVRFGVDRPWMAFFTFRLAFCASCLACSTYRCRVS